jgi:MFS transporter, PPP family, 3-phenylpropionic acid transporter
VHNKSIPYWRLSSFYFFYFATLGGFLPFWSLFLKDTGFNPLEIGKLSALLAATKIIAPNLWGWIADLSGKSLRVIRIASFLATCLFAGFLFENSYIWFAWVTIAFSFFWNAALPQFEAATLFHLQHESHRYSQIRLWGSIGFILAVLGIGRLLDKHNLSILPDIIIIMLTCIWLISLITPEANAGQHSTERIGILQILKRPEVIAFLIVYMLLQIAHGPYYVFFSIYLNELHYSATTIGLLWALGVFSEVILFLFMRRLLARFSLRQMLLVSISLSIIRWLFIAWGAKQLDLLIFAQLLHAATFAATHAVAIHLVHQYFGAQHQGKGQALYSSLSFGLGGMVGSFYSGYLWESLGAQVVYSLAAISSGIALIIALIWVGRTVNVKKTIIVN